MERDFLNKRSASSRQPENTINIHRGESMRIPGHPDVQDAQSIRQRLLRVDEAAKKRTQVGQRRVAKSNRSVVRASREVVWESVQHEGT